MPYLAIRARREGERGTLTTLPSCGKTVLRHNLGWPKRAQASRSYLSPNSAETIRMTVTSEQTFLGYLRSFLVVGCAPSRRNPAGAGKQLTGRDDRLGTVRRKRVYCPLAWTDRLRGDRPGPRTGPDCGLFGPTGPDARRPSSAPTGTVITLLAMASSSSVGRSASWSLVRVTRPS